MHICIYSQSIKIQCFNSIWSTYFIMWLLKKIVILNFMGIIFALKQRDCKPNTIQGEEQKLKNYLFLNYDSSNPPCTNKTIVDFLIYPKSITFNEHTNTLDINCISISNWNDDRLMWDEEKFNLIDDSLQIDDTEIWIPDISVHTSGDLSVEQTPSTTYCILFHTGIVWCKSSVVYTVMCYTDYTAWPFDIQYCDVQLGSWAHDSTVLNLTIKGTNWMWGYYTQNPQWNVVYNKTGITDTKNKYDWEKKSYILWIQMGLKRRSDIMKVFYITPAIVLMVLTLTSLWLESTSTERLIFVCINFICHLLCIQDLQWKLPSNGQAAPLILLYYEHSLLLAAFTILLTVILGQLERSSTKAPQFLISITNNILNSKFGKYFYINLLDPKCYIGLKNIDDDRILIGQSKKDNSWKYITILISWLTFLIILIIYFVLLVVYLPRDSVQLNVDHFETRLRKLSKVDNIITD